jgi:hypothetical protein
MMRELVSSEEFRTSFMKAFRECLADAKEYRSDCWENWTAFMTGKEDNASGYWSAPKRRVLQMTADDLGLGYEREELKLDAVFFHKEDIWGNLVAVEHENVIVGFGREVEKLMSVLAPLKVGIALTYENARKDFELETQTQIKKYFGKRHHSIQEMPETEYCFLLGVVLGHRKKPTAVRWKYLSFTYSNGSQANQFQEVGEEFRFEG